MAAVWVEVKVQPLVIEAGTVHFATLVNGIPYSVGSVSAADVLAWAEEAEE